MSIGFKPASKRVKIRTRISRVVYLRGVDGVVVVDSIVLSLLSYDGEPKVKISKSSNSKNRFTLAILL